MSFVQQLQWTNLVELIWYRRSGTIKERITRIRQCIQFRTTKKNEQICKLCCTPGHDHKDCSAEHPYCHHCSESSPVGNVESNGWNTILVTECVQSKQTTKC